MVRKFLLILILVLSGCSGGAVVFAPTPAPPDQSPLQYDHPSGAFSLVVPRQWAIYEQNTTTLATAAFSAPGSNQPALLAAVINLGHEVGADEFGALLSPILRKQLKPGIHLACLWIAVIGSIFSAYFIIVANSWMQHPSGFTILADGTLRTTSWLRVIFSPTFPERFAHMVLAAYLTTSLVVGAASAWRLLKGPEAESSIALRMAIGMFAIVAPLQLLVGDAAGKRLLEVQPAKLAAIEAFWETRTEQASHIAPWPARAIEGNPWAPPVPGPGTRPGRRVLKQKWPVLSVGARPKPRKPEAAG